MATSHPTGVWSVARAVRELPPDARWEIDHGHLEMHEPPGWYHGDAQVAIAEPLRAFVRQNRLGRVVGEAGFHLTRDPDTLRAPDVAFVSNDRLRAIEDLHGFAPVAPDLAVEVLSPGDRPSAVRRKTAQYLALGVRSVWLVDLRARRLEQHLATGEVRVYAAGIDLVEDPTLPGFRRHLGDLLPEPWPGR